MPDEAAAASAIDTTLGDAQNTPTDTGTDAGTNAPAAGGQGETTTPDDLKQGYLRHADYTRKTQELAQQRQEIEAQQEQAQQLQALAQQAFLEGDEQAAAEFLQAIGYEDEADAEYGEPADPRVAQLEKQLAEVNDFISQQKQEAEQRQQAAHIDSEFHRLTGGEWDRENPDHEAILAHAAFLSPEDGEINVEAGFKAFNELRDRIVEDYRAGKIPAASTQNLNGTPASAALPENSSPEERAASILEAHGF